MSGREDEGGSDDDITVEYQHVATTPRSEKKYKIPSLTSKEGGKKRKNCDGEENEERRPDKGKKPKKEERSTGSISVKKEASDRSPPGDNQQSAEDEANKEDARKSKPGRIPKISPNERKNSSSIPTARSVLNDRPLKSRNTEARLLELSEMSVNSSGKDWLNDQIKMYKEKRLAEEGVDVDINPTEDDIRLQVALPKDVATFKEPIRTWMPVTEGVVPGWNKSLLPEEEVVHPPDWTPPTPPRVDLSLAGFLTQFDVNEPVPDRIMRMYDDKTTESDLSSFEDDDIITVFNGVGISRFTKKGFLEAKKRQRGNNFSGGRSGPGRGAGRGGARGRGRGGRDRGGRSDQRRDRDNGRDYRKDDRKGDRRDDRRNEHRGHPGDDRREDRGYPRDDRREDRRRDDRRDDYRHEHREDRHYRDHKRDRDDRDDRHSDGHHDERSRRDKHSASRSERGDYEYPKGGRSGREPSSRPDDHHDGRRYRDEHCDRGVGQGEPQDRLVSRKEKRYGRDDRRMDQAIEERERKPSVGSSPGREEQDLRLMRARGPHSSYAVEERRSDSYSERGENRGDGAIRREEDGRGCGSEPRGKYRQENVTERSGRHVASDDKYDRSSSRGESSQRRDIRHRGDAQPIGAGYSGHPPAANQDFVHPPDRYLPSSTRFTERELPRYSPDEQLVGLPSRAIADRRSSPKQEHFTRDASPRRGRGDEYYDRPSQYYELPSVDSPEVHRPLCRGEMLQLKKTEVRPTGRLGSEERYRHSEADTYGDRSPDRRRGEETKRQREMLESTTHRISTSRYDQSRDVSPTRHACPTLLGPSRPHHHLLPIYRSSRSRSPGREGYHQTDFGPPRLPEEREWRHRHRSPVDERYDRRREPPTRPESSSRYRGGASYYSP